MFDSAGGILIVAFIGGCTLYLVVLAVRYVRDRRASTPETAEERRQREKNETADADDERRLKALVAAASKEVKGWK